jgi:hypothetical protein
MGCVKKDGFAVVGRALQLRSPRHLADRGCGTFCDIYFPPTSFVVVDTYLDDKRGRRPITAMQLQACT